MSSEKIETLREIVPALQSTTSSEPLVSGKIKEGDRTSKFRLQGKDGKKVLALADDIFAKCRDGADQTPFANRFREEFEEEMGRVASIITEWCEANKEHFADTDLFPKGEMMAKYFRLKFVVVQNGKDYDTELAIKVAELGKKFLADKSFRLVRVYTSMVANVSDEDIVLVFG